MPDAVTFSVTHVAKAIDKTPQTVRDWTARYSGYLSEYSQVETGEERRYTQEDMAILKTVARLSNAGQKHKAIIPMIAGGSILIGPDEPKSKPDEPKTAPEAKTSALAPADILERFVVRYEARIDDLEIKLEESAEAVRRAEDARRQAEVKAARLTGQLDTLYRQRWYQFWKPRRPDTD